MQEVDVFALPGHQLPDFLIASSEIGLVAVGLLVVPRSDISDLIEDDYIRDLKRRTTRLKTVLNLPKEFTIRLKVWKVRDPGASNAAKSEFFDASWVSALSRTVFADDSLDLVRQAFGQPRVFVGKTRKPVLDANLQGRTQERFRLDEAQNAIASDLNDSRTFVTGPPGSGKTLILFARIRYLLATNPSSKVLLVCFNKALAANFRVTFKANPNVQVAHFHGLASDLGVRFPSSSSPRQSLKDFLKAKSTGPAAIFDLVAVDEAQDLKVGWLKWLVHLAKPHCAGVLLAGDLEQAIYSGARGPSLEIIDEEMQIVTLEKPYRSTNQILDVIGALDPSFSIGERSTSQDGEPVQLVWAQNKSSIGDAIAKIVAELVANNHAYDYRDMAVLVPNYFWLQGEDGISRRLQELGVPIETTWRTRGDLMDLDENLVRLMTIHSAKGLEFPIVFLVGLESIKGDISGEELDVSDDPDSLISRARLNLVGPSRAKDLLFIFYTQSNAYLRRLKESNASLKESVYPEDYGGP
jgi:superfamily I DNA/RNA helicase